MPGVKRTMPSRFDRIIVVDRSVASFIDHGGKAAEVVVGKWASPAITWNDSMLDKVTCPQLLGHQACSVTPTN